MPLVTKIGKFLVVLNSNWLDDLEGPKSVLLLTPSALKWFANGPEPERTGRRPYWKHKGMERGRISHFLRGQRSQYCNKNPRLDATPNQQHV